MNLRIGTRGSLLAIAQSRLVAKQLQRLYPNLDVQLIAIESRGDRDLDTPLDQVADPDFFSAELDAALLQDQVDVCVHSYKDIPAKRTAGIVTAAIPTREDPRDAVLFHPRALTKSARGEPLIIGCCSQRRRKHVGDFLSWALPQQPSPPRFRFVDLRGAVDQRLDRLVEPDGDGVVLDSVVLAIAGLNRLFNDQDGFQAIAAKLKPLRWMIAPLSVCPTASGQGALAVECRIDDETTRALLAPLNDAASHKALRFESRLLGSCPQPEDAVTVVPHAEIGFLSFFRDCQGQTRIRINRAGSLQQAPREPGPAFDGTCLAPYSIRKPLSLPMDIDNAKALYVAHHYCISLHDGELPSSGRIWVPGVATWRALAELGLWVEGCTDHLGFDVLANSIDCAVLGLPQLSEWVALTHRDAVDSWRDSGVGRVVPAYVNTPRTLPVRIIKAASQAKHFFWTSADQVKRLGPFLPGDATHAAGPGKTARFLRKTGFRRIQVFPSRQVWHQWLA